MAEISKTKRIFIERWNKVIEAKKLGLKKISTFSREIGIKDDTLRRRLDPLNETEPTIDELRKIALYFNVSADYFLGINDVMSPDIRIGEFCKSCGLDGESYEILTKMGSDKAEIINEIIKSEVFINWIVGSLGDIIRRQSGQLMNSIPKDKDLNRGDITIQYFKQLKKNPIIDYETQYDISKRIISSFEDVIMNRVCDTVYKSIR